MTKKVQLQPYLILRTKKEHDQYIANVVSGYISEYMKPHRKDAYDKGVNAGTTYGLDMVILALGRMASGYSIEHRCETCLCYGLSCIPKEGPDICENHEHHATWRPKAIDISDSGFWVELMKQIMEAAKDYGDLMDIDLYENHDDQYWWSGSKLDKELYEYISPDIYPSFEERYKNPPATVTETN